MPHHVLCDRYIVIYLPVVYLKLQAHKIRQDGSRACLSLDRNDALAGLWPNDWKPALDVNITTGYGSGGNGETDGTIFGPISH